jgi:hypothetical protein
LFFPLLYVSVYAPYLNILGSISKGWPEKIISKLFNMLCVFIFNIVGKNKEENSSGKKTI